MAAPVLSNCNELQKLKHEFSAWLSKKLELLEFDSDTYTEYITGVLEESSSVDDKNDILYDIFADLPEDEQRRTCDEILLQWSSVKPDSDLSSEEDTKSSDTDKLSELLDSIEVAKVQVVNKEKSEEFDETKKLILERYAETVDEESDDDGGNITESSGATCQQICTGTNDSKPVNTAAGTTSSPSASNCGRSADLLGFKNTNAQDVMNKERIKREKDKQDHEKKKESDKAGREKQKQKDEERKNKEKLRTAKGERRRM